MSPPQVKVSIISEAQANSLLRREEQRSMGDSSGDILNNTGQMEYHAATRQLSVNFRNMQLRKIKRAEKKGTESVMDEKFSLLFTSQFKVAGGDFMFSVWVSLLGLGALNSILLKTSPNLTQLYRSILCRPFHCQSLLLFMEIKNLTLGRRLPGIMRSRNRYE